jgi:amino acid adenylation domain-containing protein
VISTSLDLEVREGLRVVARESGATLFVALLTLFATLLSRYSGQDEVVIGTPFAGRNRTELEAMVGYFINPLALRIDLSGDPTFSELVQRSRTTVLDAFAHADVAYETVVRAINPERDMSQTPVFQAMIVLHNPIWQTQRPKFEPDGIRCTEITHDKGWAKFDVLLGMSERKSGLNTSWEYSTELFRRETISRMMEHFRRLAESAAAGPDRRISSLSMLTESERTQILHTDRRRTVRDHGEETLKSLFERQAALKAHETAVVCGDERLTFEQLNSRANRIAHALRERGTVAGTLVGVLMAKSIDLIPAVLGVVKSGGAYVPLDPSYPDDRLAAMIADAAPKVLLTHEKHLATLPPTEAVAVALDRPGALDGQSDADPTAIAGPDDLAYVIFTSGSTGKPKGAMITNRSVTSAFHAWDEAYQLDQLSAHLQLASFSFDVFSGDLIRAMGSGAKLVLVPLEVVLDPPALHDLILREGVQAAEFVPASAALMFDYIESIGGRLDGMKLIAVASEAWRTERYARYKQLAGPNTRLVNSYGLTEATIDSTYFELEPGEELASGKLVPIGRAFANTRIYIVDAGFEPQPVGIPGELCVGGAGVGLGYLNKPELTAERFLPDPFSDIPGARLYRTGDLARWLPDGNIEFIGRADRQLKIRGFRIEPGEIEAVLERHPGVRQAAVTDRKDDRGDTRLVAYLTLTDPDEPVAEVLRALVADQLPAYMIPAAWVTVDSMPTTPNGKVDLGALPDPRFDRSANADEYVEPRTDTERVLARLWSEVLDVDQVGVDDNFFALGGHSLLAMQVTSRVRSELGLPLPIRTIFDAPTLAQFSAAVDAQTPQVPDEAPALVRVDRSALRSS